ncbi:MAG: ATP citrate lyase citrate-binding domain-containing protein [Candidatus Micrarchaeota archaeon]
MAQRAIREYDAKRLLAAQLPKYCSVAYAPEMAAVSVGTDLDALAKENPWLLQKKLVVKPDQLFGKKGKAGLVLLDAPWENAKKFLKEKLGSEATAGKTTGTLERFIVEPFVAHKNEYYFAITAERDADALMFSPSGGIDIEENWESVRVLKVPVGEKAQKPAVIDALLAGMPEKDKQIAAEFIAGLHAAFCALGMTFLELNPFTIVEGKPVPLGLVVRLDDTSEFEHATEWKGIEFPTPFGRKLSAEERSVEELDEKTGASLKLTVLNPKGRIWTLVAGGGASVIYADTVADLGYANDLAVYGEYSGDPNEEDTYQYAKTVIGMMLKDGKKKALLIGGGIANFTDVAQTFAGIIRALKESGPALAKSGSRIFVRRGGPNYQQGLDGMRRLGQEIGVQIEVYGPETHMTKIVPLAVEWLQKGR